MDELFSFIHTADMINDLQKAAIRYYTDSCFLQGTVVHIYMK